MRTTLALLAALILIAPAGVGQEPGGHVHTSRAGARLLPLPKGRDVWHFAVFGDRTGGPAEGVKVLAQAVGDVNLLDPDLVMTVGDLVQGYNRTPEWLVQMREYQGIMNGLRCPWYPVAGNHDIYWRGNGRPEGEHERDYEKHFGPLWYWFRHKDAAFIVLYSDEGDPKTGTKGFYEKEHIQLSQTQLDWLAATLKETRQARHVFAFLHHPRWITERYKGSNWDAVHALLEQAGNVKAVFAGHIHRMHYGGKRDGIEYVTLGATGGRYRVDGDARAGHLHHFNVVTVRSEGISVAAIPVGAILDPRDLTQEVNDDLDLLLDIYEPTSTSAFVLKGDGSARGDLVVKLENPTKRRVEFTVEPDSGGSMTRFDPDHEHVVVEPGAAATLTFRYRRPAIDLAHAFGAPTLRVQMDYLAPTARISLSERTWRMPFDLELPPAQLAKENDNKVLELDRGSCAEIPASFKLPDGPFTLEGWLNARSFRSRQPFIAKTESSEYALFVGGGRPEFNVHLDGRYVTAKAAKPMLQTKRWHHLAGVFDGKEARLYVDGRLVARAPGKGKRTTNAFPLYVGADPDESGRPNDMLRGLVDDVRITTRALYAGETFTPERRPDPVPGTLLLLPFDRAVGPFTINRLGAPHGRLVGNAEIERERNGGAGGR